MRLIQLLLACLIITCWSIDISAEEQNWTNKAEEILKGVQNQQYTEAKEDVKQLSDSFVGSDLAKRKLKIEAVQTLSTLLVEMDQQLNAITPNKTELNRKATQLFLAFDAAENVNKPRWKSYQVILEEDLGKIEQILPKENRQELRKNMEKLIADYQLVRPALIVAKPATAVTKMDSLFLYLREQTDFKVISEGLSSAKELVRIVFQGKDEEVLRWTGPVREIPTGFILFVSGLIASALTYVSWRKYWERKMIS